MHLFWLATQSGKATTEKRIKRWSET